MHINQKRVYLFSVDLEDVRMGVSNGDFYQDRVVINTHQYLEFLKKMNTTCTFFVVGEIARKYPKLIKEINEAGHELGCHTNNHVPLDQMTEETFEQDLIANKEALLAAGCKSIIGFRAPIFSLTQKTEWAYHVLKKLGFVYSSSVLPAKNPLYGWPEFGYKPKTIFNGLIEIPISLSQNKWLNIPFAGGVYFRALPFFLIKYYFNKTLEKSDMVSGYFHPYDIDTKQEKFMHGGINNNKLYNELMYYNRKNVMKRLTKLMKMVKVKTYREFIESI